MRKIIGMALAVLLLLGVCLACTSCELEGTTAYTQLRDHVNKKVSPEEGLLMISEENDSVNVAVTPESNGQMHVQAMVSDGSSYYYAVILVLTNDTDAYDAYFSVTYGGMVELAKATATVNASQYTGLDDLVFLDTNISAMSEGSYRQIATGLLNTLLLKLDTYCQKNVSISVDDFGFGALADNYRYTPETTTADADLGGAFSPARLKLAGTMVVVGMGMVFLVLAILWCVLIIFKKVMYDGANKKKEKNAVSETVTDAAADNEAVASIADATVCAEDDGAVVAAITAAIAEMISSDESLSREFAGGFKVVSFRKKSGKGAWNK